MDEEGVMQGTAGAFRQHIHPLLMASANPARASHEKQLALAVKKKLALCVRSNFALAVENS